jgi:hypothetical protein
MYWSADHSGPSDRQAIRQRDPGSAASDARHRAAGPAHRRHAALIFLPIVMLVLERRYETGVLRRPASG